jgi:hypothetical protein
LKEQAKERRIQTLERELDSAVLAASHARAERKQAEVAQHAAEARTQQAIQELEDTTSMYWFHPVFSFCVDSISLSLEVH